MVHNTCEPLGHSLIWIDIYLFSPLHPEFQIFALQFRASSMAISAFFFFNLLPLISENVSNKHTHIVRFYDRTTEYYVYGIESYCQKHNHCDNKIKLKTNVMHEGVGRPTLVKIRNLNRKR